MNAQDGPYLISALANSGSEAREQSWKFVKQKWDIIMERYGSQLFLLGRMLSGLLDGFADQKHLDDIKIFFGSKDTLGTGEQAVKSAYQKIAANILWKKKNTELLKKWLKDNRTF